MALGATNDDVADEVERIVVGSDFFPQFVQKQTVLGKLVQDGLLAVGALPYLKEVLKGRVLTIQSLLGVVDPEKWS